MTTLSEVDPAADVACTLPVNEASDRLTALQALVGDTLGGLTRSGDRLRVRIERGGHANLEAELTVFAAAEKACCAFLGFAIESEPDAVTLEIAAPDGAAPVLDGIEWLVRAAGRVRRLGAP
jgi:hypothetical protein